MRSHLLGFCWIGLTYHLTRDWDPLETLSTLSFANGCHTSNDIQSVHEYYSLKVRIWLFDHQAYIDQNWPILVKIDLLSVVTTEEITCRVDQDESVEGDKIDDDVGDDDGDDNDDYDDDDSDDDDDHERIERGIDQFATSC